MMVYDQDQPLFIYDAMHMWCDLFAHLIKGKHHQATQRASKIITERLRDQVEYHQ